MELIGDEEAGCFGAVGLNRSSKGGIKPRDHWMSTKSAYKSCRFANWQVSQLPKVYQKGEETTESIDNEHHGPVISLLVDFICPEDLGR